ncbi:RER1 retention in endoplasmic reticulum 1 [Polychytrium aggregatum]|uniref:RER1 retention in endoplasmic reticulum 1 n=1 Tax=Polychytrium aggregatum TaxID=110093 RepID=UPI0022FF2019|nr:RER1 retention in endoplasmic reticulum 1 [Polychytrium aggregatum]KAI9199245.1 RER1 retention in endoplasmic reticulum 1 [Polychytrium aggregatum]
MASLDPSASADIGEPTGIQLQVLQLQRRIQKFLDDTTPHTAPRWIFTGFVAAVYAVRAFLISGWYIVTYALGIYLLNLFLAFLTPKFDPATTELDDEADGEGMSLPTKADEEFRPFVRRLPEFKFWYSATKAILIAFVCTFIPFFDIPVFWPILVIYFFILFGLTMKRQIKHMIKYKYVPWDYGKKKYTAGSPPKNNK